ncbi:hypothetical protein [Sphingomonas sp. Leaf226]|jgi:hypothetical protein|uniref:hypothetical protein n=1 Tax=Sphingomonas sp. Leaf226 TaxID=1735691 RepID=UPI0007018BC9|nr:hypothetical protein [Sphingomonas sp. Leaf226]KQM96349.1 hypothetical protein ASE77_18840 [Sphingomonas sp. Leaf226]
MTIQHSIDTMQAWTYALRIIMGYPAFAPIGHTITFASGGHRDPVEALQIAAIVEQIGHDIVHVNFEPPIADGPVGVSLATRATCHVDWHSEVSIYADSDEALVELLTDRHRWFVGPRAVLTAAPLPPRGKIRRGVERATRRWREQALRSHNLDLTGSVFVPQGANFAQAIPMESLARAA